MYGSSKQCTAGSSPTVFGRSGNVWAGLSTVYGRFVLLCTEVQQCTEGLYREVQCTEGLLSVVL